VPAAAVEEGAEPVKPAVAKPKVGMAALFGGKK
jgi:hypothetical protein